MIALTLSLLVLAAPGASGADAAQTLVDDFKFTKALTTIAEALRQPGVDTATLIRLYELQGFAHAALNQGPQAKAAFTRVLTLDPAHAIPDSSPKVRTLYYGARAGAAQSPLELRALEPTRVDGRIETLTVEVKQSPVLQAFAVRFAMSADDAPAVVTVVPLTATATVTVKTSARFVKWSATLLGTNDAVLRVVERAEAAPVELRPAAPVTAHADPVVGTAPPVAASQVPWLRPVSLGVAIVGLGAVGTGIGFGRASAGARAELAAVSADENGVARNITQVRASQLESTARSQALIANALVISGGVLALAGTVVCVLNPGATAPQTVSIGVTPGGLMASGQF